MITKISSLLLVYCSISVASFSFMRTRLTSDRRHLNIIDLTARAQKNSFFVMGMTMSDSEKKLMDESFIWWVVFSDSTNAFCAW